MNQFAIADRILSEYEKHWRLPDNAWAHMAAAKIIAQLREEGQAELDKPGQTVSDSELSMLRRKAELYDQLDAYGFGSVSAAFAKAPAAGPTVDVTEIVQIAAVCAADAWSGYVPSGQSVGSPFSKFRNDFRARLEAAIKAKQQ